MRKVEFKVVVELRPGEKVSDLQAGVVEAMQAQFGAGRNHKVKRAYKARD